MNVLKRMGLCIVVVSIALSGQAACGASAEDDQTVVIGAGGGIHYFSQGDDIRDIAFTSDLNSGQMSQAYVEWYPLDHVGFGVRSVLVGVKDHASISNVDESTKIKTALTVLNHFLTMTALPFISESGYVRIGVLAGFGVSDYKVMQKVSGFGSAQISTSGPASLAQLYIDWGGSGLGARLGIGALMTKLQDTEVKDAPGVKLTADASGSHAYFDLRWAF